MTFFIQETNNNRFALYKTLDSFFGGRALFESK